MFYRNLQVNTNQSNIIINNFLKVTYYINKVICHELFVMIYFMTFNNNKYSNLPQ